MVQVLVLVFDNRQDRQTHISPRNLGTSYDMFDFRTTTCASYNLER